MKSNKEVLEEFKLEYDDIVRRESVDLQAVALRYQRKLKRISPLRYLWKPLYARKLQEASTELLEEMEAISIRQREELLDLSNRAYIKRFGG